MLEELKEAAAKATGGEWCKSYYDCGDVSYYDHNGPCPGIFSDEHDCGIVHWDGFKQEYWSSCNGDQKQIEANARLIALMCSESNRNHIIAALEAYERGPTPEQVREAGNAIKDALQLGPTPDQQREDWHPRETAKSMSGAEKPFICSNCGCRAEHTYTGLCKACLMDRYDDDQDDEYDPEEPAFECAGYMDGGRFYCPMWGSEECDWDCPNGGMES